MTTGREHFREKLTVCRSNACGHWGADETGRVGCLLHPKCPGKIDVHLLKGGGCFAAEPQFTSITIPPKRQTRLRIRPRTATMPVVPPELFAESVAPPEPNDGHPPITTFAAVTSLSLWPHHLRVQANCLDTWAAFGLQIVSVNLPSEMEQLGELYPQVNRWIEANDETTDYAKPTLRINSLADVATKLDCPVLLINSDLEIHGPQSLLTSAIEPETALVGIRHNFLSDWRDAYLEPWGLDVFYLTPTHVATLPRMGFGIGRPMWDYWLPRHFAHHQIRSRYIGYPLFYHRAHPMHWSREEWHLGEKWANEQYGKTDYPEMRRLLPHPPKRRGR